MLRLFLIPRHLARKESPRIFSQNKNKKPDGNRAQKERNKMSIRESKAEANNSKLVCLKDVEIEEVEYLVWPYLPLGKLICISGDPGVGKSMVTAALAAAVSTGGEFVGKKVKQGNVLLYNSEDGIADTTKGRLIKLGADCTRIFARQEPLELDEKGLIQLRSDVVDKQPLVVVLDPIQSFLGGVDINRANEVRVVLSQLAQLALVTRCTIIMIQHLKKGADKAIYRANGSIDFLAAARSALIVGANPKNQSERAFIHTKASLSPKGESHGFTIADGHLKWTGPTNLTADDLLANTPTYSGTSSLSDAKSFLATTLLLGPVAAKQVQEEAGEAGFAKRTIDRAKVDLDVVSFKQGNTWFWKLQTSPNIQDRQGCQLPRMENLATLAMLHDVDR